jgi:hypothetical protein
MSDEEPEWWCEVIDLPLRSKADAKRIVRLCTEGELQQTWKPQWTTYKTSEGRIRLLDHERAHAILTGASEPDAGRPTRHDWDLLKSLVLEVAATMPKPVNKTAVRRDVARLYRDRQGLVINPESGTLKSKVREWLSE